MIQLNPSADIFGTEHVILSARACRHYVEDFRAPLSIKTVVSGRAMWSTDEHVYSLEPGSFLVLNDQHAYTMNMELPEPGETFCLFFRSGFVEDIARASTSRAEQLLDRPEENSPHRFIEAVSRDTNVLERVGQLRAVPRSEAGMIALGEALVQSDQKLQALARRVPALKSSTRAELLRRLLRAREFVEDSLAEHLTLEQVAGAAALSPYHLHRTFRRAFGETLHQHVTRRRLERATILLRNTRLSILEISAAVGFESVTSFAALFRRSFGHSPSAFRRN